MLKIQPWAVEFMFGELISTTNKATALDIIFLFKIIEIRKTESNFTHYCFALNFQTSILYSKLN